MERFEGSRNRSVYLRNSLRTRAVSLMAIRVRCKYPKRRSKGSRNKLKGLRRKSRGLGRQCEGSSRYESSRILWPKFQVYLPQKIAILGGTCIETILCKV